MLQWFLHLDKDLRQSQIGRPQETSYAKRPVSVKLPTVRARERSVPWLSRSQFFGNLQKSLPPAQDFDSLVSLTIGSEKTNSTRYRHETDSRANPS
jgi:hypothetical protein